jgi:hypothetical protein
MRVFYMILAISTVPATLVLSNLLWQGFREARAVAALLESSEFLNDIVTLNLLKSPPAAVSRFAQPLPGGYSINMSLFRQSDQEAQRRGRAVLRPALGLVVLGSAIIGFAAVAWVGVGLPFLNVFVVHTTFVGSTRGSIDRSTTGRAAQHVQILALILHRWLRDNPAEAAAWTATQPQMGTLRHRLAGLDHLSNMVLCDKADPDRVAILDNPRLPDSGLLRAVDAGKLIEFVESLSSHSVYKADHVRGRLADCGLPTVLSADASCVLVGDYRLDAVMPESGGPGMGA